MTVKKKVMAKPTNKFSSLYLAVFIFTLNCGDALNITGITETNEVADLIGNIDENDWCPQQNGTGVVEDGMRPAYPNPTNSSIQLPYQIVKQTRVKFQIINKDKKVVRLLETRDRPPVIKLLLGICVMIMGISLKTVAIERNFFLMENSNVTETFKL